MAPRDRVDAFKALTGSFFARFFETEIATTTDDLKGPFFWLLAALALPGLFIPWMRVVDWHLIAIVQGPIALREASQAEKVFYLGFTMIASGFLTTIAWSSLLPDRRDTLILGALPVSPRTIVAAKLAALGCYVLLVAVSMHALASFFFGSILAEKGPTWFAVRGMVAHFVGSSAASAAVALTVAGVQGLTLAVVGPRWFKQCSTVLQVGLVGLIALGLALLPAMSSGTVHTLRGFGRNVQPWILAMPPVWFLGLYEWVLGTSDPVILELARRAGVALLAGVVVTMVTYPIAYRRLMVSVVEIGSGPGHTVARFLRALVVGASGRHSEARAAADFFCATLARVERHRFVLAIALGIALAWSLPGLKSNASTDAPHAPLLALPLAATMFVVAGLRIASSLPADVRAGWLFEVLHVSRARARQGLERTMFLLGVLPPVLVSTPVYWWLWGGAVAAIHAVVTMAIGAALIELLIWHCEGMPCGQRWVPARANLGRRWPLHLAVFLVVTAVIPRVELLLFRNLYAASAFAGVLVLIAIATRYRSARHEIVPVYEEIDPVAGVLRLG